MTLQSDVTMMKLYEMFVLHLCNTWLTDKCISHVLDMALGEATWQTLYYNRVIRGAGRQRNSHYNGSQNHL